MKNHPFTAQVDLTDLGLKGGKKKEKSSTRERRLVAVYNQNGFTNDELIYYTKSPDYCLPDTTLGSLGTRGR